MSTHAIPVATSTSVSDSIAPEVDVLPFENRFPNRLNPSNDGTQFEPCTAFSDSELSRFRIDSSSVRDAALVDGQGIRGCNWFMPDSYSLSVVVTDASSLSEYKSGRRELVWKPEFVAEGRLVGLAKLNQDEHLCSTYIQSSGSIVATSITITGGIQALQNYDACQIVVDFTSAYIDKIPE